MGQAHLLFSGWLEAAPSLSNGARTRVDPAGDEKASVVWRVSSSSDLCSQGYLGTLEPGGSQSIGTTLTDYGQIGTLAAVSRGSGPQHAEHTQISAT